MVLRSYIRMYKPGILGLYFRLFIFFLIAGTVITPIYGCSDKDNNEIITPDPDPDPDPDDPDSEVIILDPSDVQDYDKIYKAQEFAAMDMLRSDSKWSFVRSKQSEHFIVFWESGFGSDPNASTVSSDLRVDIDDLLARAEEFYDINIQTLKFAETGSGKSNLDKYKMQIYMFYQTDWLATGGGYDDVIGGLWVNPGTCQPVGSTIAHEIGHSFQYQVYADLLASGECSNDFSRGFRYGFGDNGSGGNAFWEQTAQWQSFQSYPMEAFTSYNFPVYMENYNRHIVHEGQRYASYFIHYYWADKHGIDFIGKLWREAVLPEDPIQAYMRMNSLSVEQLNADMYDAATRFVTWDIDAIRDNGANYIGQHVCKFNSIANGAYQIAYSSCPGSTGYNVVPLNVPAAGTVVSTRFTGLQPGSALTSDDPGVCITNLETGATTTVTKYNSGSVARAGWRYGYVALLNNGQRVYGEMNKAAQADVEFTIPAGCEKLWFVVVGAPNTYVAHAWDNNDQNDDQWPYTVKFTNTNILGNVDFDGTEQYENTSFTYDVKFPFSSSVYEGATVSIDNDLTKLAKSFMLQPSDIKARMGGSIQFYAVEPDGKLNVTTTANGYGHWFDASGNVCSWGADGRTFSEYDASNFIFTIGQYPNQCASGDKYTIKQALVYEYETGKTVQATFTFNITIQ
jgi:hypothetical protein